MALRLWLRYPAKSHALLACLLGISWLLQSACHDKGKTHAGAQAGSCLGVPSTPIGDDLVYPVRPPSTARGSASDPLPITHATQLGYGGVCVDGEGALWELTKSGLQRYDTQLAPTLKITLNLVDQSIWDPDNWARGPACDSHGAWMVVGERANDDWLLKVARYTKAGLSEDHTLNTSCGIYSIRVGPDGPLLEFANHSFVADGISYAPPADSSGDPWYRLFPKPDLPRVAWIPWLLAVDTDGSYLSGWLGSAGPLIGDKVLHFTRYGADGTENLAKDISGQFVDIKAAGTVTSQGHLLLAGRGGGDVPTPDEDSVLGSAFMLALDRDANVAWSKRFTSAGVVDVNGVAVGGNSIWLFGGFIEWVESDGLAAFGHMGTIVRDHYYVSSDWEHRFAAVTDASGDLKHLEPLGGHYDSGFSIMPVDQDHAVMSGRAMGDDPDTLDVGLAGPLPAPFLGALDLTGRRPAPKPSQPEETLPRLPLPQNLGRVDDVRSSHDGNAYVVLRKGDDLTFVDYPSGQILPPFHLPRYQPGDIERIGPDLFKRLSHFRLGDSEWIEMDPLPYEKPDLYGCTGPLPSGDWLFTACEDSVIAWRRQGNNWVIATRHEGGGGSRIDADASFLAVGDPGAKGLREQEGVVHVYPITADGLGTPSILRASDRLPYDPGCPPSSCDYMPGPPPGRHFGTSVQVATPWVLVSDGEGTYGFEHVGDEWIERWKHIAAYLEQIPGGALLGGTYYEFDYTEQRGCTGGSGVIHTYDYDGKTWKELQRIVPRQRWSSRFGEAYVRLADLLLVAAPGYGLPNGIYTDGQLAQEGGAVFSIPLGSCPK